jgi:hypothetical protein
MVCRNVTDVSVMLLQRYRQSRRINHRQPYSICTHSRLVCPGPYQVVSVMALLWGPIGSLRRRW